jgi:hypothetical protein
MNCGAVVWVRPLWHPGLGLDFLFLRSLLFFSPHLPSRAHPGSQDVAGRLPNAAPITVASSLNVAELAGMERAVAAGQPGTSSMFVLFGSAAAAKLAVEALRAHGQLPYVRLATAPTEHPPHQPPLAEIDCVAGPGCPRRRGSDPHGCPFRHPPEVARNDCRHWIRSGGKCWCGVGVRGGCGVARVAHAAHPSACC